MLIWSHFCSRMCSLDGGQQTGTARSWRLKQQNPSKRRQAVSLSATQLHIPSVTCIKNAVISPVHCYRYRSAITISRLSAQHCCYAYKLTVIRSPHLHTTYDILTPHMILAYREGFIWQIYGLVTHKCRFVAINSTFAVALKLRTSLNCSPVLLLRKSTTKVAFPCGNIFNVGDVILL
jgi:hypothetical protein